MDEELILAYIEERLNESEKQSFEQRLKSDAELRAAHQQALARHIAWQAVERNRVKKELKAMFTQAEPIKRKLLGSPFLIAAAAVILLVAGIWFFLPTKHTPESLALAYFEPYPMSQVRGEDDGSLAIEQEATSLYQQGQYAESLPVFKKLVQQRPQDNPLRLNYASALLALGQSEIAVSILRSIPNTDPIADASQWYLALALLQQGDEVAALPILQAISSQNHYKQQQAQALLRKLGSR